MLNLKDGDIITLKQFLTDLDISASTWKQKRNSIIDELSNYYKFSIEEGQGKKTKFHIIEVFNPDKQYEYRRPAQQRKEGLIKAIQDRFGDDQDLWAMPNEVLTNLIIKENLSGQYSDSVIYKTISQLKKQKQIKASSLSNGEITIFNLLQQNEIAFISQYSKRIDNSVYRFDFALLGENDNIKAFIEYDGRQHFEPIDYFGGKETFSGTVKRDIIKNNYCKTYGIPLIRIPYTLDLKHLNIEDLMPETSSYLIPVTKKDEIKRLLCQNLDKIAETFSRDKDEALQLLSELID